MNQMNMMNQQIPQHMDMMQQIPQQMPQQMQGLNMMNQQMDMMQQMPQQMNMINQQMPQQMQGLNMMNQQMPQQMQGLNMMNQQMDMMQQMQGFDQLNTLYGGNKEITQKGGGDNIKAPYRREKNTPYTSHDSRNTYKRRSSESKPYEPPVLLEQKIYEPRASKSK